MGKISYYKKDGTLQYQKELTNKNIGETNGMMIRCTMKNGGFCEGFADPFRTHGKAELKIYRVCGKIFLGHA